MTSFWTALWCEKALAQTNLIFSLSFQTIQKQKAKGLIWVNQFSGVHLPFQLNAAGFSRKNNSLGFGALMSCAPTHNSSTSQIASLDSYLALCEASLQIVYLYSDPRGIFTEMYATVWTLKWFQGQTFDSNFETFTYSFLEKVHLGFTWNTFQINWYTTQCVPLVSALQFTGPKSSCRHEWDSTQGKHYNAA